MTSQSPRIYTYKITFEEVPYYYYGVHKEKKFGEYYMGSPVANKWCWELYTPKKQILELFDFTDKGWIEALDVETRLIRPVYNEDKWCLNANCAGHLSLEERSRAGKIGGKLASAKCKEMGIGIFGITAEKRTETARKSALKAKEDKTGIFALTKEQLVENAKKGGQKTKENKSGVHGLSPEERRKNGIKGGSIGGKKGGKTNKERKLGICGLTPEQRTENGKKGGKVMGNKHKQNGTGIFSLTEDQKKENSKKGGKSSSSQRWICTETGYVSNPCGLAKYQIARNIDTSKRKRLE
jgi:hypothetical protein